MNKKSLSEFLSDEYKEFAMYTIENRAIPSVIDGLKPVHRKILYISNKVWKTGNEKTLKIFQLAGKIASDSFYHHGNCLDYNTEILLDDGSFISIGEWFDKYPNEKMNVISYNEDKQDFISDKGHSPRVGNITDIEYIIEMEDGSSVKCTENHPFLTQRGWVEAKDLKETDDIKSIS